MKGAGLAMRAVNRAGGMLQGAGLKLVGLEAEELLATARRRTGLADFGGEDFRAPLETLIESCEREAGLSLVGRLAARSYFLQLLEARLRLRRDRGREPGIARQAIDRPVFITGLPRSGTTLLHGLVACDPANRVPLSWEVMFPSPPPVRAADDPRVARTDRLLGWVEHLAPAFKRIHPVGAMLPQECIAITAHEFSSIEFHTLWRVPAYQARIEHDDPRRAYRFHKRFLQHLQHGRAGERWVLKAPAHLFHLDALFAVYPDARLIQTHRDPLEVAASIASYGTVLRAAFSDAVDARDVGASMCEFWAKGADRALDYRLAHPGREVVDVHYADLCADPAGTVRRIYDRLGLSFEPAAGNAMRRFLARNPRDRHGRHRYSLEQFGLHAKTVGERFGRYREAFSAGGRRQSDGRFSAGW